LGLNRCAVITTNDDLEVAVATAEYILQTLCAVEHHVKVLTAATRADEIVRATNDYLASWSRERIENLQKIDGGWGTFDALGRPDPICDVGHIARISNVLSNQCAALKDAGIQPTLELLELDLYFAVGKQMAEVFMASQARLRTGASAKTGYRHWSDNDAKAA
jgi:hypothetical protein